MVLAEHTGIPTISVPGVGQWRHALPWLRHLQTTEVLLCYDLDFTTNPVVARAFLDARRGLIAQGFAVDVETWEASNAG